MVEEHQLVTRQKAFVLLQVFMGTQRRLKQSELPKKFTVAILRMLALTASENGKPTLNRSALNAILDSLIQDGYLQRKKEQRTEFLHLTDRGIALLLSSPQYEQLEFKMTGESLSRLLKDLEETLLSQKGLTATGLNLLAVQAQMDAIFTETIRGVQTLFGNAQARLLATLTAAPVKPSPPAVPSPATEMPPDGVTTPASSIELPTRGSTCLRRSSRNSRSCCGKSILTRQWCRSLPSAGALRSVLVMNRLHTRSSILRCSGWASSRKSAWYPSAILGTFRTKRWQQPFPARTKPSFT